MNVVLFLDSGISMDSGHPNASQLTKLILNSKAYPEEINFLRCLKNYNEKARTIGSVQHLATNAPVGGIYNDATSYEDLYYLCDEIALFDWGLHNNAMVPAFIESFIEKFSPYLKSDLKKERFIELGKLAHAAKKYINSAVLDQLETPGEIKGLDLIVELANNPLIKTLDILTLNHDLLVEELLRQKEISFTDGFGDKDGDIRWFEPESFLAEMKVKIIKLHGSIDWFSVAVDGVDRIGQIVGKDFSEKKCSKGKALQFSNKTPKVLTGLNKTNYYNSGIYTDIHFHFQRILYQSNLMIMSGYGWGDESINTRLMTWLDKKKENKLILLHKNIDEPMSRSMILDRDYSNWATRNKLKLIPKWLSEVREDEILKLC